MPPPLRKFKTREMRSAAANMGSMPRGQAMLFQAADDIDRLMAGQLAAPDPPDGFYWIYEENEWSVIELLTVEGARHLLFGGVSWPWKDAKLYGPLVPPSNEDNEL